MEIIPTFQGYYEDQITWFIEVTQKVVVILLHFSFYIPPFNWSLPNFQSYFPPLLPTQSPHSNITQQFAVP